MFKDGKDIEKTIELYRINADLTMKQYELVWLNIKFYSWINGGITFAIGFCSAELVFAENAQGRVFDFGMLLLIFLSLMGFFANNIFQHNFKNQVYWMNFFTEIMSNIESNFLEDKKCAPYTHVQYIVHDDKGESSSQNYVKSKWGLIYKPTSIDNDVSYKNFTIFGLFMLFYAVLFCIFIGFWIMR